MRYCSLKCIRNTLILLSVFLSFISIYGGFRNNNKVLTGLGFFALSFWFLWFDPVTRDISKKSGSVPRTPGEIFTDLATTALLVLVILYIFLFGSSGKIFLAGLIILALLVIMLGRFYGKISRPLDRLSKKHLYILPMVSILMGIIAFSVFQNLGGMAILLGFLASAVLILEFSLESKESNDNNNVLGG